ncbi:protease modulator HflC [Candidatus Bodocaedibacter vickermanii]|uniref:Modulator of FtsH protease HflC n=1 Tax=Candidatus Bodocaedibacter vickermanii TaxID=2741701 RepID=A0A7L9RSJ5_9PROT|nr:Modulator of FtsH protease HflC [Candidatus Paracaedibacteraceae bacterium 'Lake Konstanz']
MSKIHYYGALLFGALFIFFQSVFIVMQTEQVIVLQFGEYIRTIKEPGLSFKVPFVQSIVKIDRRLLSYDLPPRRITLGDQKFLVLDSYVRYSISDPLKFFKSVRNEQNVQNRLVPIIMGRLQSALGQSSLSELLSVKRVQILEEIITDIRETVAEFGIELVDVRIRKADLPPENSKAIFSRMQSDREREAKLLRAEGEERALIIRADADKQVTNILSDARRQAMVLEGTAEATATKLLTDAYGQDRKFAEFIQKMRLLQESIQTDTPLYLSTDSEALQGL